MASQLHGNAGAGDRVAYCGSVVPAAAGSTQPQLRGGAPAPRREHGRGVAVYAHEAGRAPPYGSNSSLQAPVAAREAAARPAPAGSAHRGARGGASASPHDAGRAGAPDHPGLRQAGVAQPHQGGPGHPGAGMDDPVVVGGELLRRFEVLCTLGSGTYGRVYKLRRRSTGQICVLKQVVMAGLSPHDQEETFNEVRCVRGSLGPRAAPASLKPRAVCSLPSAVATGPSHEQDPPPARDPVL